MTAATSSAMTAAEVATAVGGTLSGAPDTVVEAIAPLDRATARDLSFLATANVGPITGEATVVQLGKTVAFIEGRLMDETGRLLATATANARLVEADRAIGQARS